jgi:hypothetical protein
MIARFINGTATLDLTTGPYSLGKDFQPPPLAMSYNIPTGSSANRYGGGELVGAKAENRDWSFEVRILGSTRSDVETSARRLAGFVRTAQYFEYQGADLPEPLWGQLGAPLRYEIVTGDVSLGDSYSLGRATEGGNLCRVFLTVRPYATGKKQRLASAKGGVYEDALGSPDGVPWGLRVLPAATNKMLNPVFGHATYDTGWSLSAATAVVSQVTDPAWVFPGSTSAVRIDANTNVHYRQVINAGSTATHQFTVIVARPDRKPVSSSDCLIYYNLGVLTTTWTALGNGWYRGTASAAGTNTNVSAGLTVQTGRAVILIAMQMEEGPYPTAVFCGDMIGCAWTGTAHESTSTRAVGRLRLGYGADTFNLGQWGVHVVWKTPAANTALTANAVLFSVAGAPSITGYFNPTTNVFTLGDATNTISSAAQTFTAGEVIDLIFTGGPGGLNIYKNGVNIATGATYTLPNVSMSYVYIGSDAIAAQQCDGLLQGFATYAQETSAAEALAIYTACAAPIGRGQRVGTLPYFWTVSGTGLIQQCDDSTHSNYVVCAGIPGDGEARTRWEIAPSAIDKDGYWLFSSLSENYVKPTAQWYGEASGTVDATASGGQYDGSFSAPGNSVEMTVTRPSALRGPIHYFLRAKGAGSFQSFPTLRFYPASIPLYGETRVLTFTANWQWYWVGSIPAPDPVNVDAAYQRILAQIVVADLVSIDWMQICNGDAAYIDADGWDTDWSTLMIEENSVYKADANGAPFALHSLRGRVPQLHPGQVNTVWFVVGGNGDTHSIAATATFAKVSITPRWSLI